MQLHPLRLGLAAGIYWGLWMFVMTFCALYLGYGTDWMILMEDVYPGYSVTIGGSIVGLIYGFIDGFVALFIFGWLYEWLGKCMK